MRIITDEQLDASTKGLNPKDYRGFEVRKGSRTPNNYIPPAYHRQELLYKVRMDEPDWIYFIYKTIDEQDEVIF